MFKQMYCTQCFGKQGSAVRLLQEIFEALFPKGFYCASQCPADPVSHLLSYPTLSVLTCFRPCLNILPRFQLGDFHLNLMERYSPKVLYLHWTCGSFW